MENDSANNENSGSPEVSSTDLPTKLAPTPPPELKILSPTPTIDVEPPTPRVMPGPPLDHEPFLRYLDPSVNTLVVCFALGTGVGEPQLASMGRQLAEEFASILRVHKPFITMPHWLLAETPSHASDSSGVLLKSSFAVFHSLPEMQTVQEVCKGLGAEIALVGRLLGEGTEFLLGVNLFDVKRGLLIASSQSEGPRDTLPQMVTQVGAHLLKRFLDEPEEACQREARAALGTDSHAALHNWSQVRELERNEAAGFKKVDRRRWAQRLIFALQGDPSYSKPLQKLASEMPTLIASGDENALRTIARGLARLPMRHPALGLIQAEAWKELGELESVKSALELTIQQYPRTAQAYYLMGIFLENSQPGIAKTFFMRACELDPARDLYRDKLGPRR